MKRLIISVIVAFLTVGLSSCGKEGCKDPSATNYDADAKKDDGSCVYPQAQLVISSPQNDAMYGLGDQVQITAQAAHTESMHGWELFLINTTTGDTVLYEQEHDHGTTINIASTWVNNVGVHSDMLLKVLIDIDHSGDYLTNQVEFHCHPM